MHTPRQVLAALAHQDSAELWIDRDLSGDCTVEVLVDPVRRQLNRLLGAGNADLAVVTNILTTILQPLYRSKHVCTARLNTRV